MPNLQTTIGVIESYNCKGAVVDAIRSEFGHEPSTEVSLSDVLSVAGPRGVLNVMRCFDRSSIFSLLSDIIEPAIENENEPRLKGIKALLLAYGKGNSDKSQLMTACNSISNIRSKGANAAMSALRVPDCPASLDKAATWAGKSGVPDYNLYGIVSRWISSAEAEKPRGA